MKGDHRRTLLSLPLAIALVVMSIGRPSAATPTEPPSPLVDKVRAATERFKNINVALADGFVQGTPCVSGPDFGAMGVHFVMSARINGGVLAAAAD